jgi:hypothetical protein
MPIGFNLRDEQRLQREERHDFLRREIEYFIFRCKHLRPELDSFSRSCLSYAGCLEEILTLLKQYMAQAECEGETKDILLEDIETTCEILPGLFQNLSNAVIARRFAGVRSEASSVRNRFALSEVHPDYAITVRAIEGLNTSYHNHLKPLFARFSARPPLVVISPSSSYAFSVVPIFRVRMFSIKPGLVKVLRERHIAYALNLSWIILPRWLPIQVRSAPILAHESFHRALRLAWMALGDLHANQDPLAGDNADRDFVEQFYGPEIIKLTQILWRLKMSLRRLFGVLRAGKLISFDREWKSLSIPERKRRTILEEYLKGTLASARRCAEEFVADIGATLIAGPAFVFALVTDPSIPADEIAAGADPDYVMEHPPLIVRATLLCSILRKLGFVEISERCRELTEEHPSTQNGVPEADATLQEYREWMRSNEGLFDEMIEWFTHLMPSCIGNSMLQLNGPTEERWIERMDDVRKQIQRGNLVNVKVTPEEVLNAIWVKKTYHPESLELHHAWRIVLRYASENL